jgi:hypothetical protein
MAKRFGDLFTYEYVCFESGQYKNCKLLVDVINEGHAYAYKHEIFPFVIFDSNTYEIHFFEEFDTYCPVFTLKLKK